MSSSVTFLVQNSTDSFSCFQHWRDKLAQSGRSRGWLLEDSWCSYSYYRGIVVFFQPTCRILWLAWQKWAMALLICHGCRKTRHRCKRHCLFNSANNDVNNEWPNFVNKLTSAEPVNFLWLKNLFNSLF